MYAFIVLYIRRVIHFSGLYKRKGMVVRTRYSFFTFEESSIFLAFIRGKVGMYALLVLYVRRVNPFLICNKRKSRDVRITRSLHHQSRPLPGRYKRKVGIYATRSLFCETATESLDCPIVTFDLLDREGKRCRCRHHFFKWTES
jgi:hypothetical protein